MHRLVPQLIQDHFAVGKHTGDFPAVGLFLDISGFTAMTNALMSHGQYGAEVLAGLMRAVMDPLIKAVFDQGGFVATSAGDALTALFPAHGSSAEACLRALAAANEIQERMSARPDFSTTYQTFRVSAKVGLALGEVRWGIITAAENQRGVYYFQGTAVDGCAGAEHQAQSGEVIIDKDILALLKEQITAEPVGEYYRLVQIKAPLPDPQSSNLPPANPGIMARFYPPILFTPTFDGEFRQVVSMFIGLPSVRTESQLQIFVESLFTLQDKYGGLLSRLDFGDKGTNLLMFWGAPLTFENDIERAVNFILDLQTATSIPISAGITYRISHAGFIGGKLYEEYTCFGRGVNLAARFMTAAPRGEIWIDEMIAARVSNRYEIEFVDEMKFKGFQQPQKVYALLERKEKPAEFFAGAMVGREAELAELRDFLRPLVDGKYAGMFVVSGEPGIGKSRLLYEIQREVEEQYPGRVQIFLGQMDEIQRQALNPFQYWLRRYFGVSDSQGEARNKRNFNRKLDELIAITQDERLSDELDRTRSFLGALIGLEWSDSLYEQLDAEGRYKNTFIALATLLQAESQHTPVIFILEDIHWLDDASKAFLPYLLRICAAQEERAFPIAFLCTSRYRGCEVEMEGLRCGEMDLQGLNRQGLRTLALVHLDAPPAESLLDALALRAEGNPFYAEQILHFMRDEGWLVRAEDTWAVKPGQINELPADVNVLLVARLDHLSQEVKEIVQTASVLGREFEINLLSRMLRQNDDALLVADVSIAEKEAIWTALNEIRYIFKHVLMRDAAYQMLLHTRRKELHRLAIQAYENLYAANLDDHYGELAYHAEQADLADKARYYLKLAGKGAQNAYQNSLAVDYFTRALAFTAESELEERCDLLLAREFANRNMGNQAARRQDLSELEAMLPVLNEISISVEVALRQSELANDTGETSASRQLAGRAKDLALSAGLPEKAAHACYLIAESLLRQGKPEQANSSARQGLPLAHDAGSSKEECHLYNVLGLIAMEQAKPDVAHDCFTQSLEISRRIGNLRAQAAPLNNLGLVAERQGNDQAAWDYTEQALEITRKTGERQGEGIALGNLGFNAKKHGEFGKARVYLEQNLRIAREIGARYPEVYGLINLSACLNGLGDYAQAVDLARQSRDLADQIGDPSGKAWALTYLGHGLLASGQAADALAAYEEALAIRQEQNQPELASEPAAGAAKSALELGDLPAARKYIEPVLTHFDQGGGCDGADEPLRVYYTAYLVLEQAGNPSAKELLSTAYDQLQVLAQQIPDEATRLAFLENIEHHRLIRSAWEKEQARA